MSDDLRAVLDQITGLRTELAHHLNAAGDPCQDRGVYWPCDVAVALGEGQP